MSVALVVEAGVSVIFISLVKVYLAENARYKKREAFRKRQMEMDKLCTGCGHANDTHFVSYVDDRVVFRCVRCHIDKGHITQCPFPEYARREAEVIYGHKGCYDHRLGIRRY
jgi:uncharacterized cysteine cluster protein YcgN (CxxCxxCC family)